jgi:hypothetical protein
VVLDVINVHRTSATYCSIGVKELYTIVEFCLMVLMITYIINKSKVLIPQKKVILVDFSIPVSALWFYCSKNLKNYLALQSFGFLRT